jgi:(aminoalkyl)phosphonate N-acetyltransferase
MLEIRATNSQDLAQIYLFVCELEEETLDKAAFEAVYLQNLQSPQIKSWLAFIDQQAVGFISVHLQYLLHHAAQVAEIQEFYVNPTQRSAGIGKQLLAVAETWVQQQGVKEIELSTNQKRIHAHRFYLREGYKNSHFKMTKNWF